ncbi:hypothetical protein ACJZ2D_008285 [Fusarium nematophilum]
MTTSGDTIARGDKSRQDEAVHLDQIDHIGGPESRSRKLFRVEKIALVKKLDWYILPVLWIMYLFNCLDRQAITNDRLNGLEENLGLEGTQYNTCVSILFAGYICCMAWSVVSLLSFTAKDYKIMVVVRFILGLTKAPFYPSSLYIIKVIYTA